VSKLRPEIRCSDSPCAADLVERQSSIHVRAQGEVDNMHKLLEENLLPVICSVRFGNWNEVIDGEW
jgi:hypothetical protein